MSMLRKLAMIAGTAQLLRVLQTARVLEIA